MSVSDNNHPNIVSIDGGESVVPSYPVVPKEFVDVPEPMMTSDGEYENVDPVVKVLVPKEETEIEGNGRESLDRDEPSVIYDEEDINGQPSTGYVFNNSNNNNSIRRSSSPS